jgi:membrane protein implicated in regulation of membrane protease activity
VVANWHVWIILAIVLFILELLIPAFVPASFGLGCLVSAIAAVLGLGIKIQILGFIAGTLVAFFGVRPFFTRYCYKASPGIKTNVEALVGKTGRVTEDIDDRLDSGRVLVGGDDWKAVSPDGTVIEKNSKVEIIRVEGAKVVVKSIQN